MDIYKFAAQKGLRFPSNRGLLVVEQLFDLPLKSGSGFDLDTVARSINEELKLLTEESFVETTATDPRKEQLQVGLDIVKDVIKTKQNENEAIRLRMERAEKRRKILDIIAAKKDEALSAASLEDLEKQLAELSA